MWRGAAILLVAALPFVAAAQGELPAPEAEFASFDPAQVALGHLLFYDPILSGSRDVSCATCHHPRFGTGDGVSLGLGDGGLGLGPDRRVDAGNIPEQRIPRNAPGLFNLGAREFTVFFHDGRLEVDPDKPGGIRTPLGSEMEMGFASALSAQSMFPVLSPDEMAGHYSENDVAQAVRQGFLSSEGGAWDIIAQRVEAVPDYRAMFDDVIGTDAPVSFIHISDAIAAFIADEWRADDSRFDRYLRGDIALSSDEAEGMGLFYGKAGCSDCHTGLFQTDHAFHAIAMPQIGPGKAARFESHQRDMGRMRVTGDPADSYAFRTPSLRNVTLTAPYGHSGAYGDLRDAVVHHLDPIGALERYTIDKAVLPELASAQDDWVRQNAAEQEAIAAANELEPIALSDAEVDAILSFLGALTDTRFVAQGRGVPKSVPSGLEVDQ
jgi:cytochrome c peroxidase